MSKIEGWSRVGKDREKWQRYNNRLGSANKGGVDVVVWECDNADIDYVLFKTPDVNAYSSTIEGGDKTNPQVGLESGYMGSFKDSFEEVTTKGEAVSLATEHLRKHPNPLGLNASDEKYLVYEVSVGQYHNEGMNDVHYASMEASRLADDLEEEFGVRTSVGEMEDRNSRGFAEGGSYGGSIPVYASEDIPESVVRRVKKKYSDYDDFEGSIDWSPM